MDDTTDALTVTPDAVGRLHARIAPRFARREMRERAPTHRCGPGRPATPRGVGSALRRRREPGAAPLRLGLPAVAL